MPWLPPKHAEASLALAEAVLPADRDKAGAAFAQAYDIAQQISIKYK